MGDLRERILAAHRKSESSHLSPVSLSAEVTNVCNLQCPMCPSVGMKRQKGMMEIGLYEQVLDEAILMGVNEVGLFSTGESVLHPQIIDFVELTSKRDIYSYLSINGALVRDNILEGLVDGGLNSLKFSIDAHNQEIYSQVRTGGEFETVINNLKETDRLRKAKNSDMKIFALYTISNINEVYIDDFKKIVAPYVDDIFFSVVYEQGGEGVQISNLRSEKINSLLERFKRQSPCLTPSKKIVVSWDGKLTACCVDFEMELAYGKYEPGKLAELWHGEELTKLRTAHENLDVSAYPLCHGCDQSYHNMEELITEVNHLFKD